MPALSSLAYAAEGEEEDSADAATNSEEEKADQADETPSDAASEEGSKASAAGASVSNGQRRPSPLDIDLSGGAVNVSLQYEDPVADVYGYELQERPSTPGMLRVSGHWYPVAHFADGVWANIGFSGSFYQGIAGSIVVDGVDYDMTLVERNGGLRGRIPFSSGLELGINAGIGIHALFVESDNELWPSDRSVRDPGLFPDMKYTYYRFGPDVHLPIGEVLAIELGVFYRLIDIGARLGELGEPRWFPNASGEGLEARLDVIFPIAFGFSALVGADLRSYGLSMNSTEEAIGSQAIAGGAVDQYLGGFVGLEWRLDGDEAK